MSKQPETLDDRNKRRQDSGARILGRYLDEPGHDGSDDLEAVTDLIANLLHYLAATDPDGNSAAYVAHHDAWGHYRAERNGTDDLA